MRKTLLLLALLLTSPILSARAEYPIRPKLVLTIVLDQFRADYLTRFRPRFLPAKQKDGSLGGFRYLMTEGAYFPFGEYGILECMTGPGHATILTGAYPYQMGIPLNGWIDQAQGEPGKFDYCVADPASPMLGMAADSKEASRGASPHHLKSSTFGDELKNAGLPSRVVSLALKDRAAILMGGHRADLAFWFDPDTFRWVSSRYYLKDGKLPDWLVKFSDETAPSKGKPQNWELPKGVEPTGLSEKEPSSSFAAIGRGFPHHTDSPESKDEEGELLFPISTELTELAAERAFDSVKLGRGPATDLLAVSFSAHDLLGHHFGPNSRELEEQTVVEDHAIAKLLNHVRKAMPGGLRDVVIVLTADHGVAPISSLSRDWGFDSGEIDGKKISEAINARLNDRFGKPAQGKPWVMGALELNVWLNHAAMKEKKLDETELYAEVRAALAETPGIAFLFTSQDYERRRLPPGLLEKQILRTYIPGKSGDVVIIPEPYWSQKDRSAQVNHVTGYAYDRSVPIILSWESGANDHGIRPGTYASHAEVVDIAPTLSFLAGVLPPAMSEGRVLNEIVVGAYSGAYSGTFSGAPSGAPARSK